MESELAGHITGASKVVAQLDETQDFGVRNPLNKRQT
jgi:hypothetical protein